MSSIRTLAWANSEARARELQALGWKAPKQRTVHHHHWAILLEWRGRGEPVYPTPTTRGGA